MKSAFRRDMRRLRYYAAFLLVMPLLPLLILGRIVFFTGIDLWFALRQGLQKPAEGSLREPVLPFWLAWLMAVSLLAAAIAAILLGFAATDDWAGRDLILGRSGAILVAFAMLFGAYRSALAGTRSLQRALVHNFALLVAYELDQLRSAAERQAEYLDAGWGLAPIHISSLEIRVPGCLEDREEIRNIFDSPTEAALSDLLASLKAYNLALAAGATDSARPRERDLAGRLAEVHQHLRRSLQILAPHLRHGLDRSGA